MKIIICASGHLGYSTLSKLEKLDIIKIIGIFTNKKSKQIINFAKSKNIKIFTSDPKKNSTWNETFKERPDLILSINYLFIMPEEMISFPKKYCINIHGSLLPKYRGRTPVTWVIINGEKETGITVHLIKKEVDTGDILYQKKIKIKNEDTGGTLLKNFEKEYPKILEKVLKNIKCNTINFKKQNLKESSYFGKRIPEDGIIDWNWNKDRIFNWVRAQTKPYPGAFSFIDNTKITIWWVEPVEEKFDINLKNGKIIKVGKKKELFVKCNNGIIKITDYNIKDKKIKFLDKTLKKL